MEPDERHDVLARVPELDWFSGYWEAIRSREFWAASARTVLITFVCTAVEIALGFCLALLLVKDLRGRGPCPSTSCCR